MPNENVCPIDGQTLEWHMKVYGHGSGGPIFFGDRLGCGYITPMDRSNYNYRGAPSQARAPEGR